MTKSGKQQSGATAGPGLEALAGPQMAFAKGLMSMQLTGLTACFRFAAGRTQAMAEHFADIGKCEDAAEALQHQAAFTQANVVACSEGAVDMIAQMQRVAADARDQA